MRYADFYGNNELRQAAFSYASLLGGRFISKDEHLVYMDAAGRSYVPPAANYGAEQMLRQVRQAASWTLMPFMKIRRIKLPAIPVR